MHPRNTLIKFSAVVLALSATPKLLSETFATLPVSAQAFSPSPIPLPASLPDGSTIKVDGSTSMQVANQAVQQRLEERFSGSTVELAENGSNQAIEALLNGDIEVAALGRFLTDEEKAKGLKEARISREKIAIIVGSENPYQGDLTFEQFAQIFRGEITDWSEIGGPAGPIRFIDRPDFSDTRIAFQPYPVFQSAPFETGANATQVADDETETVIQALGSDGIGYAIADQVLGNNNVKIIPMHQTLPDDIRYPFSQPRLYAYQDAAAPAALAFLGFATTAPGQEIAAAAAAAPSPVASPEAASPEAVIAPSPEAATAQAPVAAEPERGGGFPLWLLALPLLGGLLWWLTRSRGTAPVATPAPVAAAPVAPVAVPPSVAPVAVPPPVARIPEGRIILTPRDCRNAYAYWEVPEERKAQFREQGGQRMAMRLYDVTDIKMESQVPHSVKQFDCQDAEPDLHLPIATDDRDYVAELGYVTEDGRWLKVARSEPVRVPACPPLPPVEPKPIATVAPPPVVEPVIEPAVRPVAPPKVEIPSLATGAALAGGAAIAGAALANAAVPKAPEPPPIAPPIAPPIMPPAPVQPKSRIILTPREAQDAYAYWEAPEAEKAALKREGGQRFLLRLHDVTGLDATRPLPPAIQEFDGLETDQDRHLIVPHYNRDYLAEIGYLTPEGRWLQLARSNSIRMVATASESTKAIPPVAGIAAAAMPAVTRTLESEQRPAETARQQVIAPSVPASPCSIQNIKVHSRRNCYLLDDAQMRHLQEQTAVTKVLEPGTHLVRIKSGAFCYGTGKESSEPIVLLWIHGGRVINKKTDVPVAATWSTLNGYDETLTLEVVEPATLHAFFFDTHIEDNDDEVTLSVISLPNF